MTAATSNGHGHDDHAKPWWQGAAVIAMVALAIGVALLFVFDIGGPSLARGGGYIATFLTNLSGGLVNSRQGVMMLIQFGLAIAAFIVMIKWAIGNKAHEKKIAELEGELAEARRRRGGGAPAPAPAAPAPATP